MLKIWDSYMKSAMETESVPCPTNIWGSYIKSTREAESASAPPSLIVPRGPLQREVSPRLDGLFRVSVETRDALE